MTLGKVSREFRHVVTDADECVDVDNPFEHLAPSGLITMQIGEDGFWLAATREGYLHLAAVFAEMGLRDAGGTHFHVDSNFGPSGGPPEFSFELLTETNAMQ